MWVTYNIYLDECTNSRLVLPQEQKTPTQPWRCEVGMEVVPNVGTKQLKPQTLIPQFGIWRLMRLAKCIGAPCQKGFRKVEAPSPSPVCCQTYLYLFGGWKGFRRSPNFEDDLNRFPDSSLPALRFWFVHIHILPSLAASRRHEPLPFATWAAFSPTFFSMSQLWQTSSRLPGTHTFWFGGV